MSEITITSTENQTAIWNTETAHTAQDSIIDFYSVKSNHYYTLADKLEKQSWTAGEQDGAIYGASCEMFNSGIYWSMYSNKIAEMCAVEFTYWYCMKVLALQGRGATDWR